MRRPAGSRRRAVVVVVLVAAVTFAVLRVVTTGASRADVPGGSRFVTTRCADLVVLGLRGSGQSAAKNAGVGKEVLVSVQDLTDRVHAAGDTSVRLQAVGYPALLAPTLAAYADSVAAGVRSVSRVVGRLRSACPATRIAGVGFSQGAQVLHDYAHHLPASTASRLVLVGMIADPWRNPDDTIARWSYGDAPATEAGRLGAGPRFERGTRRVAVSLCVVDDEICNRPGTSGSRSDARVPAVHQSFYESPRSARSTGRRLYAVLRPALP